MEKNLRYKMQHIGDIFLSKLENVWGSVKGSARGIVLTYDIQELQKEKDKLVKRIGKRVVVIRKKAPGVDVLNDAMLTKLFYRLDRIEDKIEVSMKERKERLHPGNLAPEQ
ncbi:MAG: hypothetical protein JRF30_03300 [Deltaproteobacteria bacterium]|nr:hypothetical protein [Deltaproteobacteria bacterium]MBW1794570.1 hypothetical protein [Deltaproteobacteria bacterium]MBW2329963.1 hypothetical protein [Deltaproteobacteria bacterium]